MSARLIAEARKAAETVEPRECRISLMVAGKGLEIGFCGMDVVTVRKQTALELLAERLGYEPNWFRHALKSTIGLTRGFIRVMRPSRGNG